MTAKSTVIRSWMAHSSTPLLPPIGAGTLGREANGVPTPVLGHRTHGKRRFDIIKIVMPGVSDTDAELHAETVRQAELHDVDGVIALPGAQELLASLPSDRWAIVTSCDRDVALARLNKVGFPVPAVLIPADEVTNGKPDPEGFLTAAAALGVMPANALVFEDAPSGLEAARRAGIRSIATRHTTDDAQLGSALAIIDDPSAVSVTIVNDQLLLTIS